MAKATLLTFLLLAAGTALAQPQPKPAPQAPEPTDPVQQLLRQKRSQLFNRLSRSILPTLEEISPEAPTTTVMEDPKLLPELPATESDATLIGQVTKAQPYISNDRKMIYTEFTVQVTDRIKSPPGLPADIKEIALVETGGAIVLSSGRVLRVDARGTGAPIETNQRYALFLLYVPYADCYRLIKAWNLKDGKAWPMSPHDMARAQKNATPYNGMAEPEFLEAIRHLAGVPAP